MTYNDGVKIAPIAYLGLISVLVTLVIVMALQVLYFQQTNKIAAAEMASAGAPPELAELNARQLTALTQRGYVNQQEGIVAIGIDRAMELVLTDLANGKSPGEVIGPVKPSPPVSSEPVAQPAAGGEAAVPAKVETSASPTQAPAANTEEPKDAGKS